jgi:transcriptional regulator with XRE-family HTH domain
MLAESSCRSRGSLDYVRDCGEERYLNVQMPDQKYKPPYAFSTHIGTLCAQKFRTFQDLAERLRMDVHDLMRQCNGKVPPSKALVKGLAKELDINESYLEKLAEEVRKDLGTP